VAVAVNPQLGAEERSIVKAATGAVAWLDAATELPAAAACAVEPLGLDEPALILMTSGTTGRPKGIAHSIRSLLARASLNIAAIGTGTLRESLCVLPVFFGHGLIGNVLTPLLAGGRVHLWQGPDMKALARLGDMLDQRAISFMSSVPSFWKIALRVSPRPRHVLDRVHVGSAPLSIEQWREIAAWTGTDAVFNMLGMTETANWIGGGSLAEAAGRDGYVGSAWGGALAVLDDAGGIARSGRGEVLVQTPTLMLGYWDRPDLDAAAFLDGWFRTGDVGELGADGKLTLVGRLKSEINRGGIKVQAEEIDMLLERHPDIVEACAFGVPDPIAGEMVGAAIVLRDGTEFDVEKIKAWCRERVRAEAVPTRLWNLDAIPRNDRGKVVRAAVRDSVSSR
jgi:acyl-CoA synthetase (AMP-forming)/AMP-acid ligase II